MHARRILIVLVAAAAHLQVARAELGVLAVAPPPGPGPELVAVTHELRAQLAQQRPNVVDPQALREMMTGRASRATLAELDRAHGVARAAYLKGDYTASARTLRAIVERLEALPGGAEPFAQWTRAMLRLARIELALGRDAAARDLMERLVRGAPDVEVDRTLYPASFAAAVERVRAAVKALPTRTLAIGSEPHGARVYLNGRDVGVAPLRIAVAPGRHRISGSSDEIWIAPVAMDVGDADAEVILDFGPWTWLRPDAGPGLAASADDEQRRIGEAAARMGVAEVVALSVLEDGGGTFAAGSLFDATTGMRVRAARVRLEGGELPAGASRALAEYLVTGNASSPLVEVPGTRPALAAAPEAAAADVGDAPLAARLATPAPAQRGTVLGWTALGAGVASVAAAVVGVVEARTASSRYEDARRLARTDPLTSVEAAVAHNRLVAEGDAARRDAKVAWIAAGSGAAVTGVLLYVNYRRTGELGPFRF